MLRSFALAAIFSGAILTSAIAQHSGTEQEQKACTRDVQRFCRAFIDQGDMAILPGLQQNRKKLSPACQKVLTDHGQ
jgi:hypothetical protein